MELGFSPRCVLEGWRQRAEAEARGFWLGLGEAFSAAGQAAKEISPGGYVVSVILLFASKWIKRHG